MGQDLAADAATTATEKVAFAGAEWVDIARSVLEELVAEHGRPGATFSVCETFTGAPPDVAGDGSTTAAWHFRIDGNAVTVARGEIDGADMNVRADYEASLPAARLVYTPEMLAKRASKPAAFGQPDFPPYLIELHNRLAVLTK